MTEALEAATPRIAGRYEVRRVLGEGSSARTLLCFDVEEERDVAVKELRFDHVENWKYLELFEREAKMLAMLDHPGIPAVYDFFQGVGAGSTLCIVQEYIEGPSLQERMENGPMLGQQEIYGFALGVLDVLEYLHGRAPPILHRDIKPSNILLRPGGGPALIDFGGVCVGWRPPETAGTTVVGTFGYMPPEQLVGQAGPAADLYALGATLLHLVTGQAPSDFPFDTGRIEVPTNLPIQESLADLIEALLRPAPRDRPPSAGHARRFLVGKEEPGEAVAVAVVPPTVPAKSVARNVVYTSGDGPHFVDLGEPPRDPKGELKDVHRNLMHPLFPARPLWSSGLHAVWIGFFGALGCATLGGAFAVYAWGLRGRKRKYEDLFRLGTFTHGTIRQVDKEKGRSYATFKYEFDAGGSTYVAFMDCATEMARYWGAGDTVPVLFDPDDPTRSCFVYR